VREPVDDMDVALRAEFVIFFHHGTTFAECNCPREKREHDVFKSLLRLIPGLEQRLMEASEEEIEMIAELVCVDVLFIPS
jgi:hypothetical protein